MPYVLQQFSLQTVLDIGILSVIIYQILLLIRGTRAAQMLTGILIVIATFLLSSLLHLKALNWMMNKFYSSFIIILIILFQDDIRIALSRIGKKSLISNFQTQSSGRVLDEIVRASSALAANSIGALIVIERSILLNRYVDIGVLVDGLISKDLLLSIFHTSSPIHDGAVIVQKGRIAAAGCFLPLTRDEDLDPNLGTRHRAAIGVSQETDAVVVVVSEEEGTVGLVVDGKFSKGLDTKDLRKLLQKHLIDERDYAGEIDLSVQPQSQRGFWEKIWKITQGPKA